MAVLSRPHGLSLAPLVNPESVFTRRYNNGLFFHRLIITFQPVKCKSTSATKPRAKTKPPFITGQSGHDRRARKERMFE
jgi:hypothetical protein